MNIHLLSRTAPLVLSVFKEQVVNSLTAQQKKIAYLALAVISALAAIYLISYYFRSSHTVRPLPEDKSLEDKLALRLEKVKGTMLFEMRALKTKIEHIQSAKFFINIRNGDSVVKKEHVLNGDASCLDTDFLFQQIDVFFDEVKASIEIDKTIPDISWQAFLKDKDGKFYHAQGREDRSNHSTIAHGKIQEFWKIYSDQPLVNEQMEFI